MLLQECPYGREHVLTAIFWPGRDITNVKIRHKGIERRNRRSFLLDEDERKQQMSEDVNQESMWLMTLQAAMAKHRLISMLAR